MLPDPEIAIGGILFLLLWYVMVALLVGWVADKNGRSGWSWVFASLVFNPLIALLCLTALGKDER